MKSGQRGKAKRWPRHSVTHGLHETFGSLSQLIVMHLTALIS
jgi:hypothetical protein